MIQFHARGSSAHYPSAIPRSTDVDLRLSRTTDLNVDIPPRSQAAPDQQERREAAPRPRRREHSLKRDIRPDAYRAVLMNDGEVIDEAALDLSDFKAEDLDASAVYGFDLERPSGAPVGLRRANPTSGTADSAWDERVIGSQGATSHSLPGIDKPVTLEPGRYEGEIEIAYNKTATFALDVVSPTVLECTVDNKTFRRFPTESSSGAFEGHLDDEGTAHAVFSFDPDDNKLRATP